MSHICHCVSHDKNINFSSHVQFFFLAHVHISVIRPEATKVERGKDKKIIIVCSSRYKFSTINMYSSKKLQNNQNSRLNEQRMLLH